MQYDNEEDINLYNTVGEHHHDQKFSLIGTSSHAIKHANYKVPSLTEISHHAVRKK